MLRSHTFGSLVAAAFALSAANVQALEPLAGHGVIPLSAPARDAPALKVPERSPADVPLARPADTAPVALSWPLEVPYQGFMALSKYPDLDPTSGLLDYMGYQHTYDTHTGTDFALGNFRSMDRGVRIVAPADGIVASPWEDGWPSVEYEQFDRYRVAVDGAVSNRVILRHADGSYTASVHMRKYSTTVFPGESVSRGQVIGFVGSSGRSTGPHLHFEPGSVNPSTWAWEWHDPWHGPSQPNPSMWKSQAPYVWDYPPALHMIGILTETVLGGDRDNIPGTIWGDGLRDAGIVGANEPIVGVWTQLRCNQGQQMTLSLKRPDGTTYASADYTVPASYPVASFFWYWYFAPNIHVADYGTWTVSVGGDNLTAIERQFTVAAESVLPPRFWPISGRSMRANEPWRDTLRVDAMSGEVIYSLLSAPGFVALEEDSIVVADSASDQQYRSCYFQALATNTAGLTDTMFYHVVDTTKPFSPNLGLDPFVMPQPVSAEEPEALPSGFRLSAAPNPFNPSVSIAYHLPSESDVTLAIFNILGHPVRRLKQGHQDAGHHRVSWDGTDNTGHRLPSGVYLCRLRAGDAATVRRLVLVR